MATATAFCEIFQWFLAMDKIEKNEEKSSNTKKTARSMDRAFEEIKNNSAVDEREDIDKKRQGFFECMEAAKWRDRVFTDIEQDIVDQYEFGEHITEQLFQQIQDCILKKRSQKVSIDFISKTLFIRFLCFYHAGNILRSDPKTQFGPNCMLKCIVFHVGSQDYRAAKLYHDQGYKENQPRFCVDYSIEFYEHILPSSEISLSIHCQHHACSNCEFEVEIWDVLRSERPDCKFDHTNRMNIKPMERKLLIPTSARMCLDIRNLHCNCQHNLRISFKSHAQVVNEPEVGGYRICWALASKAPPDTEKGFRAREIRDGPSGNLTGVNKDREDIEKYLSEFADDTSIFTLLEDEDPDIEDLKLSLKTFLEIDEQHKLIYYSGHGNKAGNWSVGSSRSEWDIVEELKSHWFENPINPNARTFPRVSCNKTYKLTSEEVVKGRELRGFHLKPPEHPIPFTKPSRTLIIIADHCYAKKLADRIDAECRSLIYTRSKYNGWSGIAVLAACKKDEVAWEHATEGGDFTQKLLKLWQGCLQLATYHDIVGEQTFSYLQLQAEQKGAWKKKCWLPTVEPQPVGIYRPFDEGPAGICLYPLLEPNGLLEYHVNCGGSVKKFVEEKEEDTKVHRADNWCGRKITLADENGSEYSKHGFVAWEEADPGSISIYLLKKYIPRKNTGIFYKEVLNGIVHIHAQYTEREFKSFYLVLWLNSEVFFQGRVFSDPERNVKEALSDPRFSISRLNAALSDPDFLQDTKDEAQQFFGANMSSKTCVVCGNTSAKRQQCKDCKKVVYCSRKCQKRHWKKHKEYCKN